MSINQVLTKTGTWWTGGGGGATTLGQLTDVALDPPIQNNEVLAFDIITSKWINKENVKIYNNSILQSISGNIISPTFDFVGCNPPNNFIVLVNDPTNSFVVPNPTQIRLQYIGTDSKRFKLNACFQHTTSTNSSIVCGLAVNTALQGYTILSKSTSTNPASGVLMNIVTLAQNDYITLLANTLTPTEQNIIEVFNILIEEV